MPHGVYDFMDIIYEFGAKAFDGKQIVGGGGSVRMTQKAIEEEAQM
jgi:hypothetical protein